MKIAILGATSHIAKNLSALLSSHAELSLFARSFESLQDFVRSENISTANLHLLSDFDTSCEKYDTVINCIGFGTPEKVKNAGSDLFRVTERFDNLILDWMLGHPDSCYLNISSGAVYGTHFIEPVHEYSTANVEVNQIKPIDYYRLAKLNSEAKHRSYSHLCIIDIRIFSFFSRFINLEAGFLLTDILQCLRENKPFTTGDDNIVRDYFHPIDLANMVLALSHYRSLNSAVDAVSKSPIDKFSILNFFREKYGLQVVLSKNQHGIHATGEKNTYYSSWKPADVIGFEAKYNSLETIADVSADLI